MDDINIQDYKILILDDDVTNNFATSHFLTSQGFDVVTFNNPDEAFSYIQKNQVDILLLDYFMPKMNGEEFLSMIKEFNNEIVVILQTGYAGEKSPIDMLKILNIQGYFDKTKPSEHLTQLILSAIKSVMLLNELKEKEYKQHLYDLKDAFFFERTHNVSSAIKNKLMMIGGSVIGMQSFIEDYNIEGTQKEFLQKQADYSKDAAATISELIEALNISSIEVMTPIGLLEKTKLLLETEILKNNAEIVIGSESDNYTLVNLVQGMLPYLICKILMFSMEPKNNKKISILEYTESNKAIIEFNMPSSISQKKINELKEISNLCKNTQISVEFSNVFYLDKSQKSDELSCTISLSINIEKLPKTILA